MRQLFALFLVALISLQASWAVAGNYCRHEQGAAASHFGHHEHQHRKHLNHDAKHSSEQSSAGIDLDCGTCHANAVSAVPLDLHLSVFTPPVTPSLAPNSPLSVQATAPLQRPERPNWISAV